MTRALVVGAGLGGLRAAEALRASGYADEIVVVGDETWAPYNRPPLSKEALAEGITHDRLVFRVRDAAADVVWRLGERAVAADLDARTVTLHDGSVLEYDALVAATGVTAWRLPFGPPATAAAGRHIIRTLDDATALRSELVAGARVLVLGAGFIGCELAATARGLGCEVRCVAIDAAPMLRPLGPELAGELRRRHEAHGVEFHLGVGVTDLVGDTHVAGAVLSDGTRLEADVVVEALGSRCNVGWLEGNGLDLADGVLTDAALRPLRDGAPVDGVAVVGDIARFPNLRFDGRAHRVEHWSLPTDTGRRAGAVLAAYLSGEGYDEVVTQRWEVLPSFWSDQYDIRLQSFGMPGLADADGIGVLEGDLHDECVVGYHRGDELVGVVGLGMLKNVMAYRP
ncbi:MAG TPA: FAD-dependent oxidoreductase, partial [Candidatus Nanopelagicales bacterium]|nr:FAD-dependent oxidoreductase [Candidatus Nanopelagicales bacterium]